MPKINPLLACWVADHTGEVKKRLEEIAAKKFSTKIDILRNVMAVSAYIDQHLDQEISMPELAKRATMAEAHLRRQFKEVYKITPQQYLQDRRIAKAKHLLVTSDLPIAEICRQVGYESVGSFANLFKSFCGLTPAEYRRQKMSESDN